MYHIAIKGVIETQDSDKFLEAFEELLTKQDAELLGKTITYNISEYKNDLQERI